MTLLEKTPLAIETALAGMLVLTPKRYSDARGSFMETYNEQLMRELGLPTRWCQDNFSLSKRNVIRGLHYQVVQPQGKLVRVLAGRALDVAVDLRRSSPSFGEHVAIELSAEAGTMLWIPEGLAHGFVALTEEVAFAYKVTDYYCAPGERTLLWNDAALGIAWPVGEDEAVLSEKDQAGTPFDRSETFA